VSLQKIFAVSMPIETAPLVILVSPTLQTCATSPPPVAGEKATEARRSSLRSFECLRLVGTSETAHLGAAPAGPTPCGSTSAGRHLPHEPGCITKTRSSIRRRASTCRAIHVPASLFDVPIRLPDPHRVSGEWQAWRPLRLPAHLLFHDYLHALDVLVTHYEDVLVMRLLC
jgi:hypothetical protein